MLNLTAQQTAELLVRWLHKAAADDAAADWGRAVGYRNWRWFGGAQRRARLRDEVALLHAAIAMHAAMHALPPEQARAVADAFGGAGAPWAADVRADAAFRGRWVARREEYLGLLHADPQAITASIAFLRHLDVDPLHQLHGQVLCAARIGQAVVDAQGVLGHVRLKRAPGALATLAERVRNWPAPQAQCALRLLRALREGRVAEASVFYDRLTVAQSRAVHEAFDELDRARRA